MEELSCVSVDYEEGENGKTRSRRRRRSNKNEFRDVLPMRVDIAVT